MYCVYHKDRTVLKLEGEDTKIFLQGIITNDVFKLCNTHALYAFILTAQGRYQFELLLFQKNQKVYLDIAASKKKELVTFLKLHKLRSKVTIEETAAQVWTIHQAQDITVAAQEGDIISPDPRDKELGYRMLKFSAPVMTANGPEAYYEDLRLQRAIPKEGNELIAGKSIPLEMKLEEQNGIDFDKGCYLGQELQARTKHQGLVRKSLFSVRLTSKIKSLDHEGQQTIYYDEQKVGTLTSYLNDIGIAKLRIEAVNASLQTGVPLYLSDRTALFINTI